MEDQVLNNLKNAISQGRVSDFILGEGDYRIAHKLLETPTDLDKIFLHGFNKYAKSTEDEASLHQIITLALQEITKSPIGLWWCIFFIYSYYFGFIENALKFSFDVESVIDRINGEISNHREKLMTTKDFVGYRFNNGLWENTKNMIDKLNKKFIGFKILV